MAAKRAFISFDFDHDEDLRTLLVGQAKNPDSPFEIQDWSVKEPMTGDWKAKVRSRIRATNLTIVVCGEWTHTAAGGFFYGVQSLHSFLPVSHTRGNQDHPVQDRNPRQSDESDPRRY